MLKTPLPLLKTELTFHSIYQGNVSNHDYFLGHFMSHWLSKETQVLIILTVPFFFSLLIKMHNHVKNELT